MVFAEYDYQNQDQNWEGSSTAPASHNDDKDIRTHFTDIGLQYLFSPSWGIQLELPFDFRSFTTITDAGKRVTDRWSQFGDLRLEGLYTGFSPDLSAGVDFGVKLPTGDFKFDPNVVDRDTQLGSGSTDLLLGGFYRHHISRRAKLFWFAQTQLDVPILVQDDYRPGTTWDSALGIYYQGWHLGTVGIFPVGQVLTSVRTIDHGSAASHPVASGFQRVLLSPGLEFDVHSLKLYADAEVPVYQHFNGNQVAAPVLVKVSVSYEF
jgi:hypothetical protein